jgi:hypothetical protein
VGDGGGRVTPYERLAALAADELGLVQDRRLDELPALHAVRAALVATLPPDAPPSARAALERAAVLQEQVVTELTAQRDATARELAVLRRGRGAVRAYGHVARTGAAAEVRA